jgi:aminoglycoside phosphotransferase (APT) family kinase protein
MMTLIDQASNIRQGETLDKNKLDAYFQKQFRNLQGEINIKQFAGGASNLTYLINYQHQEFILRRPPFGKIAKSAHDMLREATIMQALKPVYSEIPTILAMCDDHNVIGCDFYLMERLIGIIPRQNLPTEITLSQHQTRLLCSNVIDKLIELHHVDYEKAGLTNLAKGDNYVTRQLSGWSKRFINAKTDDVVSFSAVMQWLQNNRPTQCKTCIIHNDFRFDNVVLDVKNPLKIVGVLDWEMATLGDPLMDLGNSLAYWVQADDDDFFKQLRRQPTHLAGMLTRQQVIDYYLTKSNLVVDDFRFYLVYGLFRLAAIIQQIYYRYYHKQTQDQRFANFGHVVNYLEQRCLTLIKTGNI